MDPSLHLTKNYASDLTWSFFHAALFSYRVTTILDPLPPLPQLHNLDLDSAIEVLRQYVNQIETLILKHRTQSPQKDIPSSQSSADTLVKEILDTDISNICQCIENVRRFHLEQVVDSQLSFTEIKRESGDCTNLREVGEPDLIFRVNYKTSAEGFTFSNADTFNEACDAHGSFVAFHGSAFANFYSILNNGLLVEGNSVSKQLNSVRRVDVSAEKEPLFGQGIYLSNQIPVALAFSKRGATWHHSCSLGPAVTCVAVCKVADHPTKVKRRRCVFNHTNDTQQNQSSGDHAHLPREYFVVTDPIFIRVTHIFVYCERKSLSSIALVPGNTELEGSINMWRNLINIVTRYTLSNPVALLVGLYVLLLVIASKWQTVNAML